MFYNTIKNIFRLNIERYFALRLYNFNKNIIYGKTSDLIILLYRLLNIN